MIFKHTPAPWRLVFESVDPEWAVLVDAAGHIIANVNAESGPDIPPLVSTKMPQAANARLLLAAPWMVAALHQLSIDEETQPSNWPVSYSMVWARKVLAYATGESDDIPHII